ncbi:MAG: HesB/IscA family protein [Acidiferrobacterales bacterium]
MIKISKKAADQILASAKEGDMEGMALRLAVKKDDNNAFEYGMGFDETTDEDVQVQENGVTIIFSPAILDLLKDLTIDYVEVEANKPQFIFMNPNDPNYIPPEK